MCMHSGALNLTTTCPRLSLMDVELDIDDVAAVPDEDVRDFNVVYREQRGRVLGAVRNVLGPSDEVEDVVQQAFIEIHRSLPRFEGRSRLSTWVYRIAVNVALQHVRRRIRKRWLRLGSTGSESENLPSRADAVGRLEGRELLEHVYAQVDRLSAKKRAVWTLHEIQGLDPGEISQILDIPVNTVRSRLIAARNEMKAALERAGVIR